METTDPNRFRPISITPVVCKVHGAFVKGRMLPLLCLLSSVPSPPPVDSGQLPLVRRIGYRSRCLLRAVDIIFQNSIEEWFGKLTSPNR